MKRAGTRAIGVVLSALVLATIANTTETAHAAGVDWVAFSFSICDRINANFGAARSHGLVSADVTFVRALSAKGATACVMTVNGVDSGYVQFADTTMGAKPRMIQQEDLNSAAGPWPANLHYTPYIKKLVGDAGNVDSWWPVAASKASASGNGALFSVGNSAFFECGLRQEVNPLSRVDFGTGRGCQIGNLGTETQPNLAIGSTISFPLRYGDFTGNYGSDTADANAKSAIGIETATTAQPFGGECKFSTMPWTNSPTEFASWDHALAGFRHATVGYQASSTRTWKFSSTAGQFTMGTPVSVASTAAKNPDGSELATRRTLAGCVDWAQTSDGSADGGQGASFDRHRFYWSVYTSTPFTTSGLMEILSWAIDGATLCPGAGSATVASQESQYFGTAPGYGCLFVPSTYPAADPAQWAVLQGAWGYAHLDAVELDGGGSTQLTVENTKVITSTDVLPVVGTPVERTVPVGLAIYAAP